MPADSALGPRSLAEIPVHSLEEGFNCQALREQTLFNASMSYMLVVGMSWGTLNKAVNSTTSP